MKTSDLVFDRLKDWGVSMVFGMPGDGINGFIEALRTRQKDIRFVQVRHEEAAALMACGYAKFTGRLYDAKLDGAPVLALTGQTYHDLVGTHYQQEVDLLSLFKDVSVYNQQVLSSGQAKALVDAGCRAALASRGVAHLTCPVDLQEQSLSQDEPSAKKVTNHTSSVWSPPIVLPQDSDLEAAASLLNAGKKTVILAGQGALKAGEELEIFADRLAAPIVKPLLGKAAVPDDSPYTTGGIGLLGTLPSELAMEECDSLLMAGTSFPYLEYYPRSDQARAVQIDCDQTRIGLRFPIDVGLTGDTKATLSPTLSSATELSAGRNGSLAAGSSAREARDDVPLKPQLASWASSSFR
jgi:pyruvate dehydrogenase (quinone)